MAPPVLKHRVKEVEFLGRRVPVVMQAAGGASPLLAVVNVLLLRNSLQLRPRPELSPTELLSLVASKLLDLGAEQTRAADAAAARTLSDAVAILPRLASAVPLDVRFSRIHDFDLSPECAIFDLLDVFLCHGWLPDPADAALVAAAGARTRSGCATRAAALASEPASAGEVALLRAFLDEGAAAGGMTRAGIAALLEGVPDRQLCVLYRAGAFHAAFRREEALYTLITDEAALLDPEFPETAVWEELPADPAAPSAALIDASFVALLAPGSGAPVHRATHAAANQAAADAQPPPEPLAPLPPLPSPAAAAAAFAAPAAAAAESMRAAMAAGALAGGTSAGAPDGVVATAALERDHVVALRMQEAFEEQERAARKAVRQAASRLQAQAERGSADDSAELRAFVARVEDHVGDRCSLM